MKDVIVENEDLVTNGKNVKQGNERKLKEVSRDKSSQILFYVLSSVVSLFLVSLMIFNVTMGLLSESKAVKIVADLFLRQISLEDGLKKIMNKLMLINTDYRMIVLKTQLKEKGAITPSLYLNYLDKSKLVKELDDFKVFFNRFLDTQKSNFEGEQTLSSFSSLLEGNMCLKLTTRSVISVLSPSYHSHLLHDCESVKGNVLTHGNFYSEHRLSTQRC